MEKDRPPASAPPRTPPPREDTGDSAEVAQHREEASEIGDRASADDARDPDTAG